MCYGNVDQNEENSKNSASSAINYVLSDSQNTSHDIVHSSGGQWSVVYQNRYGLSRLLCFTKTVMVYPDCYASPRLLWPIERCYSLSRQLWSMCSLRTVIYCQTKLLWTGVAHTIWLWYFQCVYHTCSSN